MNPRLAASSRLTRAAILAGVGVGLANAFAELVIYGRWIVPRLASAPRVPLLAWLGMYTPVFLVSIAIASRLRSRREVIVAALTAGTVVQLEKWLLAIVQAPGHAESLAVTDPPRFWSLLFARMTFGFVVLFFVLHASGVRSREPDTSRPPPRSIG